jgi:hypothetical protein
MAINIAKPMNKLNDVELANMPVGAGAQISLGMGLNLLLINLIEGILKGKSTTGEKELPYELMVGLGMSYAWANVKPLKRFVGDRFSRVLSATAMYASLESQFAVESKVVDYGTRALKAVGIIDEARAQEIMNEVSLSGGGFGELPGASPLEMEEFDDEFGSIPAGPEAMALEEAAAGIVLEG